MHFEQFCTHERCKGYWAIRVDAGELGGVSLAGARAVVAFDCPQRMIDGGWIEAILLDEASAEPQRRAMETILRGDAGGPWSVLARFVGRRLDTRVVPIHMHEDAHDRHVTIAGLLNGIVTNIRGRDRTRPVRFENIFNQIHAPSQVLATGHTQYDDGTIQFENVRTHGLHSQFDWNVR